MPESEQAPRVDIRTPDQRLRVFVSSTLGECRPSGRPPVAPSSSCGSPRSCSMRARGPILPRSLYRAYLEQSDVFVGIYWQRYGWVGPT